MLLFLTECLYSQTRPNIEIKKVFIETTNVVFQMYPAFDGFFTNYQYGGTSTYSGLIIGQTNIYKAMVGERIRLNWSSRINYCYMLQTSSNLFDWVSSKTIIAGNGSNIVWYDFQDSPQRYYRIFVNPTINQMTFFSTLTQKQFKTCIKTNSISLSSTRKLLSTELPPLPPK